MSDLDFAKPHRKRHEEEEAEGDEAPPIQPAGEWNLYHLTLEFLGYLRRVEGVPYAKGELGRRELHQYLLDHPARKLEYRESMLQSAQRDLDRRLGRRVPSLRKSRPCDQVLVPDRKRLDRFLAGRLGVFDQLYYRAAALFGIVPSWLRFLEAHGLIDAETRTRTLSELAGLADNLCQVLDDYAGDPAPPQALENWPERAGIAPPG
jgi:hypothetical protein